MRNFQTLCHNTFSDYRVDPKLHNYTFNILMIQIKYKSIRFYRYNFIKVSLKSFKRQNCDEFKKL